LFYLALAHGATFPLSKFVDLITKNIFINAILVLLVFGNLTDIFTNRTLDLCQFNFTLFDAFCPPDVHLTPENFMNQYKYVFIMGH